MRFVATDSKFRARASRVEPGLYQCGYRFRRGEGWYGRREERREFREERREERRGERREDRREYRRY